MEDIHGILYQNKGRERRKVEGKYEKYVGERERRQSISRGGKDGARWKRNEKHIMKENGIFAT